VGVGLLDTTMHLNPQTIEIITERQDFPDGDFSVRKIDDTKTHPTVPLSIDCWARNVGIC
jgi:hypothetical protein